MVIKIRMEVQDGKSKSNITFEGLSYAEARNRIDDFLSYAYRNEVFEPPREPFKPEFLPEWIGEYDLDSLSQKDKVLILLKRKHPEGWVRSQQIKEEYEATYAEQIKLSSLSTYLARFYNQGVMKRRGSRAQREYQFLEKGDSKSVKAES